jgi:hypothetical protein
VGMGYGKGDGGGVGGDLDMGGVKSRMGMGVAVGGDEGGSACAT